jgi:hypothetical protein
MADWVTISSLATAGGTLVLAVATFASVRSANRAARVAEISVLANLRPLLMPSRLDDPLQKVGFFDERWVTVPGSGAAAEVGEGAVYLAMSVRNVGAGTALLHGWWLSDQATGMTDPPLLDEMIRLSRDIFVPAGDVGFWQGAFRDSSTPGFALARRLVEGRQRFAIAVMYGDLEGGQRTITRFGMNPKTDGGWLVVAARVWNIDRPAPR